MQHGQTKAVAQPDRQSEGGATATTRCENPACAKETSNPRFCSKSCAASVNNQNSPKRKAGGECERCYTAIPRRRRYCQACQLIVRAEAEAERAESARRCREHYRTWLNLSGERREGPTREVSVNLSFRIDLDHLSMKKRRTLREDDSAGELLDYLIGLCFTYPMYLRRTDADRYITLLNELKEFRTFDRTTIRLHECAVRDVPIRSLRFALKSWVDSYFAKGCHPMMPAYAMDTGRFVEFHIRGEQLLQQGGARNLDPPYWGIEPLLSASENDRWWNVFDKSFRREFSLRFGQTRVYCTVPSDGRVIHPEGFNYVNQLGPGSTFPFVISRCHLSQSLPVYGITCQEQPLQFDLMAEFCFEGKMVIPHEEDPRREYVISATVPGRWITHAFTGWDKETQVVAVPRWGLDNVPDASQHAH